MRAAVLTAFSSPLEIREVPEPRPRGDEVLVRVRAVGLCGTDLKLIAGALEGIELPRIPGHEVAGEVVGGPPPLQPGDRVACHIPVTCGSCPACLEGRESQCENRQRIGLERDGGLAELIAMPQESAIRFDPAVDWASAAVAMDAVATPWSALHGRGEIEPGQLVLVVGAGGLGLNAVQIAVSAGARVAVVDPAPARLARARELGAEVALAPGDADELSKWTRGLGVDLALEASGAADGFRTAVGSVGRGRRIVCCGYWPNREFSVDSATLVRRELEIRGSLAASRRTAAAALAAVEEGAIRPEVALRFPLAQVNEALVQVCDGGQAGRVVIEPG